MIVGGPLELVRTLKAVGATPRLASIWLGPWSRTEQGRIPDLARHIIACKAEGVEPLVHWFGAGDQISQAFFDGGVTTSRGIDLGKWWGLVKALGATLAANPCKAVVVIEDEWFKADLRDGAPRFDEAWASAAYTIKGAAQGTRIVNCPGEWAPGSSARALYPKMVAATDIWGVQNLRCLTRDPLAKYAGGPLNLLVRLRDYAATFPGKPLIVSDLGYSTYGGNFSTTHPFQGGDLSGADQQQKTAFEDLVKMRSDLEAAGVTDIILRDRRDVDMNDAINWFGKGEDGWGLVRLDGTRKPAYDSMLALAGRRAPTLAEYQALALQLQVAQADVGRLGALAADTQARLNEAVQRIAAAKVALDGGN